MITSAARCDDGIPLSGQTGFLASVRQSLTSSQPRPASLRCRWNVTVAVGRIINVTLYDFGVSTRQRLAAADERPRLRFVTINSSIEVSERCGYFIVKFDFAYPKKFSNNLSTFSRQSFKV